jgi:hypothetical protein
LPEHAYGLLNTSEVLILDMSDPMNPTVAYTLEVKSENLLSTVIRYTHTVMMKSTLPTWPIPPCRSWWILIQKNSSLFHA